MEKDYNIDDILDEVKKRHGVKPEEKIEEKPIVNEEPTFTELTEEPIAKEPVAEEPIIEEPVAEESVIEASIEEEPAEKDLFIDLNAMSAENNDEEAEKEDIVEPPKKKKKKKGLGVKGLAIFLAIILALGVGTYFAGSYIIDQKLKGVVQEDQDTVEWTGMDTLVENFTPIEETDASELASFKDHVKTWYQNGEPASSTHVLNILLIGEDTRGDEILDDSTRADSAIICSINKDTQQITLTSILRDTYAYWENEFGNESTGQFNKINAAMSLGDVKTYCKTVEQLYKIKIDNYVIVNFTSFEKIIDTLGGVTLEITTREINEINSHQKRYGNVTIEQQFEGTSGKQKLNGKQALAYCRIRKLDSDNMRANRQKTCLTQVYKEVKETSFTNLVKIIDQILPYVKTNMPVKSIKKIAKYALSDGWLGFNVENTTVPEARINEKGSGGIHWGTWCWKTDFPQDAYNLQMKIYGKSSITLARTRVDVLNCAEEGFYKDGASPVTAVIYNEHYGEVTTLPAKESTTE